MRILQYRHGFVAILVILIGALFAFTACSSGDNAGTNTATSSAAAGTATATPQPVTVRAVLAIEASSFLPVYAARYNNFYAQEGINLDYSVGGTGGKESAALIAGDADIVFSSGVELLKLAAQNRPVIAVGGIEAGGVDEIIMLKSLADQLGITANSPLADKLKAANWTGKKVGFTSAGALSNGLVLNWAHEAGVSADNVQQVALGAGATQIAAMQQGSVDYISSFHPFSDQMIANGSAIKLVDMTAGDDPSLKGFLEQILMTTSDYASKNPDVVKRFVKATVEGSQWINTHTVAEVVTMWQSFDAFKTSDPASLTAQVQAFKDGGIFPSDGAMSLAGLQTVQTVLLNGGILTSPVANIDKLIDTSYLP